MAIVLAILIFLTIAGALFAFGAAAYAPSSILGSRLRSLAWQRPQVQEKPAIKERIEQAKADWKAGRFEGVPGETEFIPLPE